jgi:hypothetical protein
MSHGIAAVALSLGWIAHRAGAARRHGRRGRGRQVEVRHRTESTQYVGRSLLALARDGCVMCKSGRTLVVGQTGARVRSHRTSKVTGAFVPRTALLRILGEQRLDLHAHDTEVVGVGR